LIRTHRIRAIVRCLLTLFVVLALGQAPFPAIGAEQDDAIYRALVQRVEGGDFAFDFRSLRLSCVRSSLCEARGTKAELGALNRASERDAFGEVIEIAEQIIARGFVNIEAHATCVKAYAELHDSVKAKFHLDVTSALMHSILNSGDGKTKESAFEVISDREEYYTLTSLGLPYSGSDISTFSVEEGGHHYDRVEIRHPKTGEMVVVFFNTDAFSPTKSRVEKE